MSGGAKDQEHLEDRFSKEPQLSMRSRNIMSEAAAAAARHRGGRHDEVQLLTLKEFGPHVRVRIGGLVTARSVKYLGNLASKLSDQETRDSWWSELRDEIRSHARTLCCWHVIGLMLACGWPAVGLLLACSWSAVCLLPACCWPYVGRL